MAEDERVAHLLTAQVEVAVAQARVLPGLAGKALDLKGGRLGVGDQIGSANPQLVNDTLKRLLASS